MLSQSLPRFRVCLTAARVRIFMATAPAMLMVEPSGDGDSRCQDSSPKSWQSFFILTRDIGDRATVKKAVIPDTWYFKTGDRDFPHKKRKGDEARLMMRATKRAIVAIKSLGGHRS